jgi:hypothetical protein
LWLPDHHDQSSPAYSRSTGYEDAAPLEKRLPSYNRKNIIQVNVDQETVSLTLLKVEKAHNTEVRTIFLLFSPKDDNENILCV